MVSGFSIQIISNVQYSTTSRSPIYFLVVANVLLQLTREPLVLNNEFISELQYDSFSHLRRKFMYLTKSTYTYKNISIPQFKIARKNCHILLE